MGVRPQSSLRRGPRARFWIAAAEFFLKIFVVVPVSFLLISTRATYCDAHIPKHLLFDLIEEHADPGGA